MTRAARFGNLPGAGQNRRVTLSDSRRSNLGAQAIVAAFDAYRSRFRISTGRAPLRFAQRDWVGAQADGVERLALYREIVDVLEPDIRDLLGERVEDPFMWAGIKAVYSGLIAGRDEWELAETFFNSVTRRIFTTVGVDPRIEFVATDFAHPPTRSPEPVYRTYERSESVTELIRTILEDYRFEAPYADIDRDAKAVAERVTTRLREVGALQVVERTEVVRPVFFRGQSAFIVGRMFSGSDRFPIVLALNNEASGVYVDAVLLRENEVSILFSFTRSYFKADVPRPYDLMRFLKTLVPRKRAAEIYIGIGENKHGKTELYRDLLRHLDSSSEQFELARGTKGMVMVVFTMPGYDDVFKIIRDRFPPVKKTTRSAVMAKYRMVFQHDRAGRLMDVQDFQHLSFDLTRFSDDLVAELLSEASDTVRIEGDQLIISHVYVERRVIPLDIFVREAGEAAAREAVVDFGLAIKDMACTNIFPGDLLIKNFGVTRHGRVVFYDYDELSALTDMTFRAIPPARFDDDEMSAEPWFSVGASDVFPEEHRRFLGLQPGLKEVFEAHHADLFEVEPWLDIQERVRTGELIQVFAYGGEARLPDAPEPTGW